MVEDDRESLNGRRAHAAGDRGRRNLRAHSARSVARDGFPIAGRRHRRRGAEPWRSATCRAPSSWMSACRTNQGSAVLDRLKRDVATRHIPIHVVSGGDHAQTALSLGAVGYMLKPVKREELADVLKKLEAKLSQRMHRVLIVEDDTVQREAVGKLLTSHDVETVGAGTAAECLELLKEQTFDCMVLDLSLPGRLRLFAAGDAQPGGRLFLSAGHRLYRPRPVGGRRAAPAALFEIDHHQGREVARAAAGRGDAVPAPSRLRAARRAAEDDPQGAEPRRHT